MGSLLRLRGVAGWTLLAILFMPGLVLLSVAINNVLGRQPAAAAGSTVFGAPLLGLIIIEFLYQFFFFNATGEESGWSGFARPHLQARFSPLLAALVVAFFWAPWHLFLWYGEGRDVLTAAYCGEAYLNMIPMSIIFTWLYNRSRGSIPVAGCAHAAGNTAVAFATGLDRLALVAVMAIVALLLVLIDRMWEPLPAENPAVSRPPRLAV